MKTPAKVFIGLGALAGAGLLLTSRKAKASAQTSLPSQKSGEGQKMSGEIKSSRNIYVTPLDKVGQGAVGTWKGKEVTLEPLLDLETGLYARLDYPTASKALAGFGKRLFTEKEWYQLLKEGVVLEPCTLVHSSQDQYFMRSLNYARKHDECVRTQPGYQAAIQGGKVLVNAGKQWLNDPENLPLPNGSVNFGWFRTKDESVNGVRRPKGTPIQTPGRRHEASYTDYSQLTMGIAI